MNTYYVNNQAQPNGDHEVHAEGCRYLPKATSIKHLGEYSTCFPAVVAAKSLYPQSNGCRHCCYQCHILTQSYETDISESVNLLLRQ